jgi:hypothetical protein
MKQQKAQFYILAAALLVSLAFGALYLTKIRYSTEDQDNIEKMFNNYEQESNVVINKLIKEKNDNNLAEINMSAFNNFNNQFIEYARTINANTGIVYVLKHETQVQAGNYLGQEIQIIAEDNYTITNEDSEDIDVSDNFTIIVDDTKYDFIIEEDIELNALLRSQQENKIRVKVVD